MARYHRPLTCLMIALLALGGTATAASLVGDLTGSAESDQGSASFDGDFEADESDARNADSRVGASAEAHDHKADAFVDSDGNGFLNVDDRAVSTTDVDVQDLRELETPALPEVPGLPTDGIPGAPDLPEVPALPELPSAAGEATADGKLDGLRDMIGSLKAAFAGLFQW